jgi:hypothetical protein
MMSATFFTNLIQKKEEKQKKIEVFSSAWSILKSLNLTEDWLWELYSLIIIMSFKCVWSYNDWEVASLKRRRHRSWIELKEWMKRVKSTLRFSIQHDEREATSVAQDINRTFE